MYKHWDEMTNQERALELANETVDDLRSSLGCGLYDPDVLRRARKIAVRRGNKTIAAMLRSRIRKLEKEDQHVT